mmetsp:Transcript_55577/g.172208  ORF Transcript_55577/g.172208 Transcript_55577/m.172208 type:complete len:145 (-) Transcript_55577:20-454(-)|eukprot:CAMPEP_0204593798 /NCGR_PEP_ID=MMETSP0661-20131031/51717_1 /ASSEMBLY_ACC=CAM_ASM_000606 /TAXON_ID=109239 /ORGANISM="Alexandrium margalefi, Strain AMGDE01CS-322" /LENGTH=144 /DNA_ID=CAMNT_0051604143 /DNA_START=88 /DNA_END=522 /DNA_ORIENTATION=+
MSFFEVDLFGGDGLAESWRNRRATVRCMRHLRAVELDPSLRQEVDEALNPPMPLILAGGGVYAAAYAGLLRTRRLQGRPLVVQLAACAPAAAVLCLGGLCRGHALLRRLLERDPGGALASDLRAACGELAAPGAAIAAGTPRGA